MDPQRPPQLRGPAINRILLNVLLDGMLAALATPLARYIADPGGGLLRPLWFVAGGAITLLLAGLPFRMPQQYWRFAGIEDLVGLVGSSVASAILFAVLLTRVGLPLADADLPGRACPGADRGAGHAARRVSPADGASARAGWRGRRRRCCWSAPETGRTCSCGRWSSGTAGPATA